MNNTQQAEQKPEIVNASQPAQKVELAKGTETLVKCKDAPSLDGTVVFKDGELSLLLHVEKLADKYAFMEYVEAVEATLHGIRKHRTSSKVYSMKADGTKVDVFMHYTTTGDVRPNYAMSIYAGFHVECSDFAHGLKLVSILQEKGWKAEQ